LQPEYPATAGCGDFLLFSLPCDARSPWRYSSLLLAHQLRSRSRRASSLLRNNPRNSPHRSHRSPRHPARRPQRRPHHRKLLHRHSMSSVPS
jgi:hypothetical protein